MTTKLGTSGRAAGGPIVAVRTCRLYAGELVMAVFLLSAAVYAVLHTQRLSFSVFLLLQGSRCEQHIACSSSRACDCYTGCVFLSFAFNLVDGGGLLGFRLEAKEFAVKQAAPTGKLRVVVRKAPSAPLGAGRLGKGGAETALLKVRSAWPLMPACESAPLLLAGWGKRGE